MRQRRTPSPPLQPWRFYIQVKKPAPRRAAQCQGGTACETAGRGTVAGEGSQPLNPRNKMRGKCHLLAPTQRNHGNCQTQTYPSNSPPSEITAERWSLQTVTNTRAPFHVMAVLTIKDQHPIPAMTILCLIQVTELQTTKVLLPV